MRTSHEGNLLSTTEWKNYDGLNDDIEENELLRLSWKFRYDFFHMAVIFIDLFIYLFFGETVFLALGELIDWN